MTADDNEPPKNPFVRWKQHVDTHIGLTLNGLLGIPSIVTKNLNIRPQDDAPSARNAGTGDGGNGTGSALTAQVSQTLAQSGQNGAASSASAASASSNPNDSGVLDGVDAAQLLEWHKFIYYSPYSPLTLQQQQQHRLLPPPIPQDMPYGADPFSFTYTDAFEDLLRASSNRPMLDLATRSYRNFHYRMRYGNSVEPPYVFFHRLHTEKLLDAYFPRTAVLGTSNNNANEALSADTPNDSVVQAVQAASAQAEREPWREHKRDDDFDNDFDEDEDDNAFGWTRPSADNDRLPGRRFGQGGLFNELDRVFRVLSRIIDEDTGVAIKKRDADAAGHDADAEDELYTAVRSAYSNAEKSLSAFVQSLPSISGSVSGTVTTKNTTQTQPADERQGETIETTENHTDVFGNRHVKVVVRRLDADGHEISRETRYTIRAGESAEKDAAAAVQPAESQQAKEDTKALHDGPADSKSSTASDGSKPSGWFWK